MTTTCEEFRRALGRLHDGEASPAEAAGARAHAAACAGCAEAEASLLAAAERLLERGGPLPGEDPAPVPGLREAVLARIRRGDAAVLDLRPFLRRAAAAAAAVLVAATAAAAWQSSRLPSAGGDGDGPAIHRKDVLAAICGPRLGGGR
ncbi:MAG: zf-HC2 domain-containing protein [Planctomycetes bacterium]|nr:zf-HC2 domain-containing protein [Planctomycetota bacterium]